MWNYNERFRGICPILTTPFHDDGQVDYKSLRNVVRLLLEAGVHGIALFGNASEGYSLTQVEKVKIAQTVREEVAGAIPLVFGAGGAGLETAVENCLWAQESGADFLMIMPPHMIKPDPQRMYDYFAAIASAVSIPIILQDAPNACGVAIPVDIMIRLSKDFDNIQYVKEEGPPTIVKMQRILESAEGRLTVMGGANGLYCYEEFCYGSVGCMPAAEFPEVMVQIYNSFFQGNREEARSLFARYLPYIRMGTLAGGYAMSIHKEILKRGGVIRSAFVRNPCVPADEALKRQTMETLEGNPLLALSWSEKHGEKEPNS
ncbi:dihydrodipicolinate synthase family protein [Marasmitruncus massiliensis]|uniref:dihydrodipicolinate synthase family protein n=1 Tax=Marasmitruncus massiliensis TaxID=1944642 RepID=UPI000C79B813|nr:dihydrodipicolinate synthase family protein [Marasmitruncus massiliensis]MBE6905001.1 dihydrodipicolinate synthase family protein [Oscillospiraceae bacterium]